MRRHAGAHCPIGHSFVSAPARTVQDEQREQNEEQLLRVISVNGFRVVIAKVRPVSKRVHLTGPDAERALLTLARCGWTSL